MACVHHHGERICIEAVAEAIYRFGSPGTFNTDQGSQFTAAAFTGRPNQHGIRISRNGQGVWCDNVFVERMWKGVKYGEVYLKAYHTVSEARASIGRYFKFTTAADRTRVLTG